jgi:hypothetical protein
VGRRVAEQLALVATAGQELPVAPEDDGTDGHVAAAAAAAASSRAMAMASSSSTSGR